MTWRLWRRLGGSGGALAATSVVLANAILVVALLAVLEPGQRGKGKHKSERPDRHLLTSMRTLSQQDPLRTTGEVTPTWSGCTLSTCLDMYQCGAEEGGLKVHITPPPPGAGPPSKEFAQAIVALVKSRYFAEDPREACVILPAWDPATGKDANESASLLAASNLWRGGVNHLLFSCSPGIATVPRGAAMVAAPSLTSLNFAFDVSLPALSPSLISANLSNQIHSEFFLLVHQTDLPRSLKEDLELLRRLHPDKVVMINECGDQYCIQGRPSTLSSALARASFCIVGPSGRNEGPDAEALTAALVAGCAPVLVDANWELLPFNERLDWSRFSILVRRGQINRLADLLSSLGHAKVAGMKSTARMAYQRYMKSPAVIMLTAMKVIEERLFPQLAYPKYQWTPSEDKSLSFLDHYSPDSGEGFTAVVLTYNRPESLFILLKRLASVPSLAAIVVVWNNPNLEPPSEDEWPATGKPLEVIRSKANLLSNRFIPYEAIRTDCVLSLDDDITMLTDDELEFGYRAWLEHPNRLVGFPSRTHVLSEAGDYRYESEWTNDLSMVLTGAAFYHSYWHWAYTGAEPHSPVAKARGYADEGLNCEDIAFNFMVAEATGKAPIKVGPRKKFRAANGPPGLSGELKAYMEARSECVRLFAQWYGHMPLMKAEFRANPVLYKEDMPERLRAFKDIGSL